MNFPHVLMTFHWPFAHVYVQDVITKLRFRVGYVSMPLLFAVSGFGIHLKYRQKQIGPLLPFYVSRLERIALSNVVAHALMPHSQLDHFTYGSPIYSHEFWNYAFPMLTLGAVRPIITEVINFIFCWRENVLTRTSWSGDAFSWLNTYVPDAIEAYLWFLSFTVICTVLYPALKTALNGLERVAGVAGLVASIGVAALVGLIPILTSKKQIWRYPLDAAGKPNVSAALIGPIDFYADPWCVCGARTRALGNAAADAVQRCC